MKLTQKVFSKPFEAGKWYALQIKIEGDTLSVSIDGAEVGALSSTGIAHPIKHEVRLDIPKKLVLDDVKIISNDR